MSLDNDVDTTIVVNGLTILIRHCVFLLISWKGYSVDCGRRMEDGNQHALSKFTNTT